MMIWFLCSVLDSVIPSVPGLKGVKDSNLAPFLKQLLKESPFLIRFGLYISALSFVFSPILTVYLPLPSFLLSARLRNLHAERASSHRIYLLRQSMFMLKMIAGMCWGQDSEVRATLGLETLEGDPGTFREAARDVAS